MRASARLVGRAIGFAPRALAPWTLAASALALLACAGVAGSPRSAAGRDERPEERQVLATVGSLHPNLWPRVAREVLERYGATLKFSWPMRSVGEQCLVFETASRAERDRLAQRLERDERFTSTAAAVRYRTLGGTLGRTLGAAGVPPTWNDTYAGLQHALATLEIAPAHRLATGRGVRIALVDTGVDLAHPDLAGRIVAARDFVRGDAASFTHDRHGTAVAGVVAADANNGQGVVGVAPDSALIALKACWSESGGGAVCDSYTLAQAVDAALLDAARVLNLSLAGPEDAVVRRLLEEATRRGTLVVAAVDESGRDPFPASMPEVLAVASREWSGRDASGLVPHPLAERALRAPGLDVLSTGPAGSYDFFHGSSFAAAAASGVAALLLELEPTLSPADIVRILAGSAHEGSLDACGALAATGAAIICGSVPAS